MQLTPWVLPSLLALLIVLRDVNALWPVRREAGALALITLAVASGGWAILQAGVVAAIPVDVAASFARLSYAPSSVAAVAWAWFAYSFSRRNAELLGAPMLFLVGMATLTFWFVLDPRASPLLFEEISSRPMGEVRGVLAERGIWHWIHLVVLAGAILGATRVLQRHVASREPEGLPRATLATAAFVAFLPLALHEIFTPGQLWADLSPLGFALASTTLRVGLLRERVEGLGPVARSVVMQELRDPVVVLDRRGRFVDVNRAAEEVLGFEPYGEMPVALGTLWAGAREKGGGELPRVTLQARVPGDEVEGEGSAGQRMVPRTFEVTVAPLHGREADGRVAMVLRDVTDRDRMERDLRTAHDSLARANEELERLARTDSLTGLANRRHFMEVLDTEIDRAWRYERPLSVVLLDLDHFKKVNDSYGHAAGDSVLRSAATVLRSVCRDVDLAARVGGEEMALILPETDPVGARVLAERVRSRLEDATHRSPSGDSFHVTASIGVAWLKPGVDTGDALLQMADKALYHAKSAGRNRVVLVS